MCWMTCEQVHLSMEAWELLPAGGSFKFMLASSGIAGKAEGSPRGDTEEQEEDKVKSKYIST